MFRNHLKIGLRNLLKDRSSSLINLLGLTIGLTCCLLIGLYIWNEMSFDQYHSNADRIYRVNRLFLNEDGSEQLHLGHVAPPFGPLLKNDFPDIEAVVRMLENNMTVQREEAQYNERNMFFAEPALFKIFDIPVVAGNVETALEKPLSVMLSKRVAKKYFPNSDPIGGTLKIDGDTDVTVTGVFEELPFNSHFHPELLLSFSSLNDENVYGRERLRTNWGNNAFSTYIMLPEAYPVEKLEAQFPAFLDKNMAGEYGTFKPSRGTKLDLIPLTDIHLHSHLDSEIEENGDMRRVQIFAVIALLVLLIACINYMNLSTARSANRAKEIGIRKVVGARRGAIIGQFLSEAIVLSIVATILAVMLSQIGLPVINKMLGQELQVTATMLGVLPIVMLSVALITGLLSGLYPAFYLSGMKPLRIIKGNQSQNREGGSIGLRKVLVISQFAVSAALIIATLVVYKQLDFIQTKDLGFDKDHVVTLGYHNSLDPQYESFRNRLLNSPNVKNIARSSRTPAGRLLDSAGPAQVLTETDTLSRMNTSLKSLRIDFHFLPTYGLDLAAGRNYSKEFGEDKNFAFILNQTAASNIGWTDAEDAIGKRILYGGQAGQVVGVVKDFNFESLHQGIQPMIFYTPENHVLFNALSVKLDGENVPEALAELESVWKEYLPQYPFEYEFVDDNFGRLYEAEQRQSKVFIGFAILAILVACLGLFGLTAFVARQRMKEIGIRKVLGATTAGIVGMLSKDFLKPVFISLLIAAPLAYYFMDKWLQDFAYRMDMEWWIFGAAAFVALAVAFFTVSFQSLRAALMNPVESLRSE